MSEAKQGDTVHVHYTGRLADGTTFDSSKDRDPLELTLGQGAVIPGFEKAIEGMTVGDQKTAEIPVDEAYGPRVTSWSWTFRAPSFPTAWIRSPASSCACRRRMGRPFRWSWPTRATRR
jgi:FKBP-type peptidyl-prolyl cis-trans isomerase 2